jgi:periplasmic protein CpxP/Spy
MTYSFKISLNQIISIAVVALGVAIAPHAAQASAVQTTQVVSQAASSPPAPKTTNGPKITLNEEQKAKIGEIHKNESSQILAVLTPEQKTIIQKAAQANSTSGSIEADLKLTQDQKTKIASIQQESRKKIESVLTPEQLQLLKNQRSQ